MINSKINYFDNRVNQLFGIVQDVNEGIVLNELKLTNLDSLQSKLISLQIEKEAYSQMVNREADRLIFYVTGLFILLGFLGFGVFKQEMTILNSEYKKRATKNDKKYQAHKKFILKEIDEFKADFNELKSEHLLVEANLFAICADIFANNEVSGFRLFALARSVLNNIKFANLKNSVETNLNVIIFNLIRFKDLIIFLDNNPSLFIEYYKDNNLHLEYVESSIESCKSFDKSQDVVLLGCEILITYNKLKQKLLQSMPL